jgi:hypothetical protein
MRTEPSRRIPFFQTEQAATVAIAGNIIARELSSLAGTTQLHQQQKKRSQRDDQTENKKHPQ